MVLSFVEGRIPRLGTLCGLRENSSNIPERPTCWTSLLSLLLTSIKDVLVELPNRSDLNSIVVRHDNAERFLRLHHDFDHLESHALHGATDRNPCPVLEERYGPAEIGAAVLLARSTPEPFERDADRSADAV